MKLTIRAASHQASHQRHHHDPRHTLSRARQPRGAGLPSCHRAILPARGPENWVKMLAHILGRKEMRNQTCSHASRASSKRVQQRPRTSP